MIPIFLIAIPVDAERDSIAFLCSNTIKNLEYAKQILIQKAKSRYMPIMILIGKRKSLPNTLRRRI